jgi:hypothetical protein
MYRFIVGFIAFIGGLLCGYQSDTPKTAHQLDYKQIAINIPITQHASLSDKTYALGEKYLAESLAAAFNQAGFTAKVYTQEDTLAERNPSSGYEFYMREFPEIQTFNFTYREIYDSDRISVLYETTPYPLDVVKNVDIVFTGSLKRYHEFQKSGINAYFVPQFTSSENFYPAYDKKYQTDVLYIANQWPDHPVRQTVQFALDKGIKLDIYGNNWDNVLKDTNAALWKAKQIPNNQLKYYYSSAKIVLNDMRKNMLDADFINNRVFDVTACKGFLISSYSPAIKEIYGDTIPMFQTADELKSLVDYYLAHPKERQKKAELAYQITINRFERTKIVKEMLNIMETYRRQHMEAHHEK